MVVNAIYFLSVLPFYKWIPFESMVHWHNLSVKFYSLWDEIERVGFRDNSEFEIELSEDWQMFRKIKKIS